MTPLEPARLKDLERFLLGWERREAPPPPGVYVVEELYSGRLVEEYCARYHLIYLVAVYDRDGACRDLYQCCSAPPPADAPSRCFIFGDVEWREELAEKCRVETYLYRFDDIQEGLKTLLEFGIHVRGIPCTYFSLPVLKITEWCDVDPICCDVSSIREKLVESATQRHTDTTSSLRRGEGGETDGSSGGGESIVEGAPSQGGGLASSSEVGGGCGEFIRRVAGALGADVDRLKRCLCNL
jgi:hypothetical protein